MGIEKIRSWFSDSENRSSIARTIIGTIIILFGLFFMLDKGYRLWGLIWPLFFLAGAALLWNIYLRNRHYPDIWSVVVSAMFLSILSILYITGTQTNWDDTIQKAIRWLYPAAIAISFWTAWFLCGRKTVQGLPAVIMTIVSVLVLFFDRTPLFKVLFSLCLIFIGILFIFPRIYRFRQGEKWFGRTPREWVDWSKVLSEKIETQVIKPGETPEGADSVKKDDEK